MPRPIVSLYDRFLAASVALLALVILIVTSTSASAVQASPSKWNSAPDYISARWHPHSAYPNWYAYCNGDPVNNTDPMGTRVLVGNDSLSDFDAWVNQNLTFWKGGAGGSKLLRGWPQNGEGAEGQFHSSWSNPLWHDYTSKFWEIEPNWGNDAIRNFDLTTLGDNDAVFAAMVADPNRVFVFDKGGWRMKTDDDEAGLGYKANVAAGSAVQHLEYGVLTAVDVVGEIAFESGVGAPEGKLLRGVAALGGLARLSEALGAGAKAAGLRGLGGRIETLGRDGFLSYLNNGLKEPARRSLSYSLENFSNERTLGQFVADAPTLLKRKGLLGRLGVTSPVYTGGQISVRPNLGADLLSEVLTHEGAHLRFALQSPELKYLQSSWVPGVRGASAFLDELQAYRTQLGGGFHPGRAWSSLSGSEKASLLGTGAAVPAAGTGIYLLNKDDGN